MSNNALAMLKSSQEVADTNSQRWTIREEIVRLTPKIPPGATWQQLPRLKIKGVEYIANEWLNRSTDSLILQYGNYLIPISNLIDKEGERVEQLGGKIWVCHLCDQEGRFKTFDGKATSAARKHLTTTTKSGHSQVLEENRVRLSVPSVRQGVQLSVPIRERLLGQGDREAAALKKYEDFQKALVRMMVVGDIPSNASTIAKLRATAVSISNDGQTANMFPKSATTIDEWIFHLFNKSRHAVRAQLRSATSKIHLSFDTWSSPYITGFVAIVAHFVDDQFKLRKRLLGLRRVEGICNSHNMWGHLNNVIEEYGIRDRLGFYTLDNRGSNGKALKFLLKFHHDTQDKETVDLLVKQSHIRCIGHVINIIAGNFMFLQDEGEDHTIATSAMQKAHYLNNYIRELPERREAFRQEVSKAKNKNSLPVDDQDIDEFLAESDFEEDFDDEPSSSSPASTLPGVSKPIWELEEKFRLSQAVGNSTTWNEIADMISNMLSLKIPVNSLADTFRSPRIDFPLEDVLSEQEWACLDEVLEILEPFERLAYPNEDNGIDLPNVMADLHELERHLRKYLIAYGSQSVGEMNPEPEVYIDTPPQFQSNSQRTPETLSQRLKRKTMPKSNDDPINNKRVKLENGEDVEKVKRQLLGGMGFQQILWALLRAHAKLQEYLRLLDENPAYWAAVVLHPGCRLKGVRKSDSDLASRVQDIVGKYWKENYADPTPPPIDTPMSGADHQDTAPRSRRRRQQKREPRRTIYDADYPEESSDELQRYLNLEWTEFGRGDDPLKWWQDRQEEFPQLHKFALDVLSIPATTAECERVFSLAEPAMHRKNKRRFEATQCLKHWLLDDSSELWRLIEDLEIDGEVDDAVVGASK